MDKFTLKFDDTILMVVDVQERLVAAMKYGKKVVENTGVLIAIAEELNIPIVVTEQYPEGLGKTVSELRIGLKENLIYEKLSFSAYTNEVATILKKLKRTNVVIAGMETHVCVFQTVRDLLDHKFQVFIAQDAVCSRTKENYKNGIFQMAQMGAVITNVETILFDLLKKAGTPQFKKLSKLIK